MRLTLASFLLGITLAQQCSKIDVRKEIRDLSQAERDELFNAIKELNTGPQPTPYDQLTKIHVDNNNQIHYVPQFLPWHRHYVHHMQTLLRVKHPNIVMPYWDWARDSQAPERSEIFTDQFFGGTGTEATSYCVPGGPFANFQLYYRDEGPQPHCLRRSFDKGDKISAFAPPELINSVRDDNPSYDQFSQNFERVPHALPHNSIGGGYGEMSQHSSPNDPIFWVHHGYVDKIWSEWQARNGLKGFEYSASKNSTERLVYFGNVTVDSLLDTRAYPYCYTYAGVPSMPTRPNSQPQVQPSAPTLPPIQTSAPAPVQPSSPAPAPVQPSSPAPVQPSAPAPVQPSAPAPVPVQTSAPAPVPVQPSAPAPVPIQPSTSTIVVVPTQALAPAPRPVPSQPRPNPPTVLQPMSMPMPMPKIQRPRHIRPDQFSPFLSPNFPNLPTLSGTRIQSQSQSSRSRFFVPMSVIQSLSDSFFSNDLFRRADLPGTISNIVANSGISKYGSVGAFKQRLSQICPPRLCPSASDRENQDKLRIPSPIPERWIRMFNGDIDEVRDLELKFVKVINKYNANPSYISQASLRYWSSYHASSSSSQSASSSSKNKTQTKRTTRTITTTTRKSTQADDEEEDDEGDYDEEYEEEYEDDDE